MRPIASRWLLGLVCLASTADAQLVTFDPPFQVNTYTTDEQGAPAVSSTRTGTVIVWESAGSTLGDTSGTSILGQRYDVYGAPAGAAFQVNTSTTGDQTHPGVGIHLNGMDFLVVWQSAASEASDASGTSIHARRYDTSGLPVGGDFQVNTWTTNDQSSPAVASIEDGSGALVAVWTSDGSESDDSATSIQAQLFDHSGTPIGGQFQVNSYTTGAQTHPAVAVDGTGFLVVWESTGSAGTDDSGASIQGRRFDSGGVPLGTDFQVNTYTTGAQRRPAVAPGMVVWESTGSDGSDTDGTSIQARRYLPPALPAGAQFQVNTFTTGDQDDPAVTAAFRHWTVAWTSDGGSDPSGRGILGQRYDLTAAVDGEFQLNSYTSGDQGAAALSPTGDGDFIATWTSAGSPATDTDGDSVQARFYERGRTLLGRKLLIRDPTGSEQRRKVLILSRTVDLDALAVPTDFGATLRVITTGTTPSDTRYFLGPGGWSYSVSLYKGTPFSTHPIRRVLIKRSSHGTRTRVKAVLAGSVGMNPLTITPPDSGDVGGMILTVHGGPTYCVVFGGAAGGLETVDDGESWVVVGAQLAGCPPH